VISVCGLKGGPGVTTLGLLMLASWPSPAVLVEADPDGGALALRLAGPQGQVLPAEPSISDLAMDAATRTSSDEVSSGELLWSRALQTSCGAVVCGLASAQPMTQLLREYARPLAALLGREENVLVDAGRLLPDSPTLPLLAASTVVVVVVADRHDEFWRATDLLPGLLSVMSVEFGVRSVVLPVVVASERRGPAAARELDELLAQQRIETAPAGWLAIDAKAAAVVPTGPAQVRRSILWRSAQTLIDRAAGEQDAIVQQRAQRAQLAREQHHDASAQWRGIGRRPIVVHGQRSEA
jgi:hypothetical protein